MTEALVEAIQTKDVKKIQAVLDQDISDISVWDIWKEAYFVDVSEEVIRLLYRRYSPFDLLAEDPRSPLAHILQPNTPKSQRWQKILSHLKFGNPASAYPDGVTNLMIASTIALEKKPVDRLLILSQYLKEDPDLKLKDDTGHTALDYARDQGSPEAVRLLEQDKTRIYYTTEGKRYLLNFSSTYQIIELLAHGSTGEMYLAQNPMGQLVALKGFPPEESSSREGFFNEYIERYPDPAFVAYLDYFTVFGLVDKDYLVFEYVEGTTLNKYVFQDMTDIEKFLLEYFRVMGVIQQTGASHNSLHGANLMIDSTGQLRVVDWGSACIDNKTKHPTLYDCKYEDQKFSLADAVEQLMESPAFADFVDQKFSTKYATWSPADQAKIIRLIQAMEKKPDWDQMSTTQVQTWVKKTIPIDNLSVT